MIFSTLIDILLLDLQRLVCDYDRLRSKHTRTHCNTLHLYELFFRNVLVQGNGGRGMTNDTMGWYCRRISSLSREQ
jgi:hypothetical protein